MKRQDPEAYGSILPIVGHHGKRLQCQPVNVDPWRELAINIHHGSDSYSASPRDRVRYHYENFPEEWPTEEPTPEEFDRVVALVAGLQ